MCGRIRSYSALAAPLALLVLLLLLPAEAAEGARAGLSVCAGVIVPSLFPFLVLSGTLSALQLPEKLAALAAPLLRRLGLPAQCAAPFLLGLCGGYPAGAVAVAELVRSGAVSPEDGTRMLPWCNNTGPGFIVAVAGGAVFGSVRIGLLLFLAHALSALALALLIGRQPQSAPAPPAASPPAALSDAFSAGVGGALRATLGVCSYIVFFSVLTALLRGSGLFSALAAALSLRCHTELRFAVALLTGCLELGSGVAALRGMAASPANLALAAFLLGFGGLSVHAQTRFAVSGTKIRCARHFAGRIVHGLLSAVLLLLLLTALRRLRIGI